MPLLRFGKTGVVPPQHVIGSERETLWSEDGARRVCGNSECAGGWTAPWRSRRRPIFEGQWGCCGRCVLAMVRAAVQRESVDGTADDVPHRHRVPLGLVMLAQGWITQSQLRTALDAQRAHGTGRIGDWLVAECGVGAERVTRGLSVQWNCPVLTTEGFSPEAMALVMPRIFVEEFGLLPLRVAGSRILYLGFQDRRDSSVALALEQMTELRVESGLLGETQFASVREKLLGCEGVPVKSGNVEDLDSLSARITAALEQKQPVASRLLRVRGYFWLRMWLEASALGRSGNLPASGEDLMDYVFSIGARA
ncbi:hypothetical protein [Edaphobacter acidisoli]|nr:hypothetical protein [Edaphobacter acidisoli]